MSEQGFIYFAMEVINDWPPPLISNIKIGWTGKDPFRRINSLSVGNPHRLWPICFASGTEADEKAIHGNLVRHKKRGEWFTALNENAIWSMHWIGGGTPLPGEEEEEEEERLVSLRNDLIPDLLVAATSSRGGNEVLDLAERHPEFAWHYKHTWEWGNERRR